MMWVSDLATGRRVSVQEAKDNPVGLARWSITDMTTEPPVEEASGYTMLFWEAVDEGALEAARRGLVLWPWMLEWRQS